MLFWATVSFTAVTWVINPQLLEDMDLQRLLDVDQLLVRFQSGEVAQQPAAIPAPPPSDGYVQTAFDECRDFFPRGKPPIVPAGLAMRELCFTSFAILHSGDTKTPVFVAQRLNSQMLKAAVKVKRNDNFYEEARLPQAERATLADYRGSGFDRGHMAPAGDMHNDETMAQSFSLANMVPQNAQHNRGAWNKIEQDVRKYVKRAKGDVYVVTGPVYKSQPKTIGQNEVAIPTYLYKAVYDATTGRAFVHWHQNSEHAEADAPISYETFVDRSNMHWLSAAEQ